MIFQTNSQHNKKQYISSPCLCLAPERNCFAMQFATEVREAFLSISFGLTSFYKWTSATHEESLMNKK